MPERDPMMDDPQKAAEVIRLAEVHIHQTDEQHHGLHRDGCFVRRGQVESMRYYRVEDSGSKDLVHCEVTIGTVFEKFSVRVMNEEAIAPFKVGEWVEIQIRAVEDRSG
jgi:hypothetical protein